MNKNFKETNIPEDFTRALAKQSFMIGPSNVWKIVSAIFHGASSAIGAIKNTETPKAIIFRSMDNSFLAAAKIQFVKNGEDLSNGRWDYTWSFYEEDIKGFDTIEANTNTMISTYYAASAQKLYNMRFASPDLSVAMATLSIEMIKGWLRDNASTELTELSLDGIFKASSIVNEKGEVELGLVPSGEMKVLVKDDAQIQEK